MLSMNLQIAFSIIDCLVGRFPRAQGDVIKFPVLFKEQTKSQVQFPKL